MLGIVRSGLIESDEELLALIQKYGQVVVPADEDLEVTHWWVLQEDGVDTVYLGTPLSFLRYMEERNGGVQ